MKHLVGIHPDSTESLMFKKKTEGKKNVLYTLVFTSKLQLLCKFQIKFKFYFFFLNKNYLWCHMSCKLLLLSCTTVSCFFPLCKSENMTCIHIDKWKKRVVLNLSWVSEIKLAMTFQWKKKKISCCRVKKLSLWLRYK